jgi:ketosteroid isomerase-like protein
MTDAASASEIVRLEHACMNALQARDLDTLERLLGHDFTLTTGRPGHEVRGRSEWLAVSRDDYRLEEYAFEELEVQHYGTCAVARSRFRQRGAMGDEPRNTTYRMTDVWVRMPDGWKLQARHAQPIEGD